MKNFLIILALISFIALIIFIGLPQYNNLLHGQLMKDAEQAFKKTDYNESGDKYARALEIKPDDLHAVTRLGHISYVTKDYKNALKYYKQASELAPDDVRFHFNVGLVYKARGENEQAKKEFQKTLEMDKNHPTARKHLAEILWDSGEKQSAIALLKKSTIESDDPIDPVAFRLLADYYLSMKKNEEARKVLESALRIEKPHKLIFDRLLSVYEKEQNDEKADKILNRYMSTYPDDIDTYLAVSQFYEKRKQPHKAEKILELAKDKLGNNLESYFALSGYYRRHKEFKKGIEVMEQALTVDPNSNRIYFTLGLLYSEIGKYKRAEDEYKRALAIRYNDANSLNGLAWMYLIAPDKSGCYKPKEALKFARKAYNYSPGNPAIVDTFARACYANGNYSEATVKYSDNIQRGETVEYANYGLAVCYYKMRREKLAKKHLDKALELKFNDKKLINQDMDLKLISEDKRIKKIIEGKEKK
ncbi:MAG: tetratricopeptide repeat protein [Candidatus Eremiobacteraeota bacterium]|nr:tetratricopeptide repeat protein [Candidatus Eremiobacteraeota bacterium]